MERILPSTDGHKLFRKTFAKFVAYELVPHYQKWEENGIVPGRYTILSLH